MPRPLQAARTLLLVWAACCLAWVVIAGFTLRPDAHGIGVLVGAVLPELVGGALAWRMRSLPRWPFFLITVIEIVLGIASVLGGSTRGIVQLVLPVIVLVLLLRARRSPESDVAPSGGIWGPAEQRGASMIEYGALVVVILVLLGTLVTVGIPQTVSTGIRAEVCRIFQGGNCDKIQAAKANNAAKNNDGGNKNDGGKKQGDSDHSSCHGFWGCAWHYTGGQAVGLVEGVGKSLYQMGDGLVTSIMHPTQFLKGLDYAASHPGQALKSIFLGDAVEDWEKGNYGEAIGDVLTNTGSLFIPYADIATGAGDAGKVGKLGELGKLGEAGDVGKLGDLGELAGDADRAAGDASKAAKDGDVGDAQKAAQRADSDAKKAEEQGRKDGCKVGALGPIGVPGIQHLGRFGASMGGDCSEEEQKKIDDAENAKKRAQKAARKAKQKKGKKGSRQSGKEKGNDLPSGVNPDELKPTGPGDTPTKIAKRYMDKESGGKPYDTGPGSRYNKIKKYVSRKYYGGKG